MPNYPHFSNHPSLPAALLGFAEQARRIGLNVGVQESLDAFQAAACGVMEERQQLRYALRAIFCNSQEDVSLFDEAFDSYWGREKVENRSRATEQNHTNLQQKSASSLVMLGKGRQASEEQEESKNVSGANAEERLRKTDFSVVSAMESQLLEEIAEKLWRQMSLRLKRKLKSCNGKGRLDLRRTIRSSIGHGGDPIELKRKQRRPRRQRLVILLDVSGSMDKYSFFLLRFVCALRQHFEKIDAFIFSTSLVRITEFLTTKNLELTLAMLSNHAGNWSSGTKIGDCLQDFNERYAKQALNGNSTCIILSDGLDTGEPKLLANELRKIRLRTRQLIWLNPLKGMAGYEPIQKGMSAALPEINVFRSAHSLDSLLELEHILLNV
jgi:uncharacterized protein with von Willebrand factor type A (vWA) domain